MDNVWATLLGGADSRRAAETDTPRIISHPIVSGATPARQLKKGPNPKCNEYLIYGQSKYRLRAGVADTDGTGVEAGVKSPAQGIKPRTGHSK